MNLTAAVLPTALVAVCLARSASATSGPHREEWWFSGWALQQEVWPLTKGRGVTVAVIDSGVNASVPDLAGVVLPGKDYTRPSDRGMVDHDHAVAAPGVQVGSIGRDGHLYHWGAGTSSATALTSGIVALIRSRFPDMPARQVVQRLVNTAKDVGPKGKDDQPGYGLLIVGSGVVPLIAFGAVAVTLVVSRRRRSHGQPGDRGSWRGYCGCTPRSRTRRCPWRETTSCRPIASCPSARTRRPGPRGESGVTTTSSARSTC